MAIITVKYLGNFSLITRRKKEEITVSENENIPGFINILRQRYGREFEKLFDSPLTVVWVNETTLDREALQSQEDETILSHGDRLIIATLAGGG